MLPFREIQGGSIASILGKQDVYTLFDSHLLDGAWVCSPEQIDRFWPSGRLLQVLGMDAAPEHTASYAWEAFVPDAEVAPIRESLLHLIQHPEQGLDRVFTFCHRQGTTLHLRCQGIALKDEEGSIRGIVATCKDVSYLKQTEQAWIEQYDWLQKLLHNQSIYILSTDMDAKYRFVNDYYCARFGFDRTEIIGMDSLQHIFSSDVEKCLQTVQACIAKPNVTRKVTLKKLIPDGEDVGILDTEWEFIAMTDLQGEVREILAIGKDISEQVMQGRQLARLKKLEQHESSYIIDLDASGNIQWVSQGFQQHLGYRRQQLIGSSFTTLLAEHMTTPAQMAQFQHCLAAGEICIGDAAFNHADGSAVAVNLQLLPEYDDQNALMGFVVIGLNIQQKVEAEQELRFQSQILQAVGQAVIVTDLQGNITYWNQVAERMYGWTANEVMGQSIIKVTPTDQSQEQAVEIMAALGNGKSWSGEFMVRDRNDRSFPIFVTNSPVYDAEGTLSGLIGVSTEISERKRNEEALRISQQRYQSVAENLPGMVVQYGVKPEEKDEILFISGGCEELFEYTLEEAKQDPQSLWDCIFLEDAQKLSAQLAETVTSGGKLDTKFRIIPPRSKDLKWLHVVAEPMPTQAGGIIWNAIVLDITEQKRAEELWRLAEQLEIKNRETEQFAYAASHDMQEPLRTIINFSHLLERRNQTSLDAKSKAYLRHITEASHRMNELIQGLLGYSRIGSDRLKLTLDVQELLQNLLRDLHATIQQSRAVIDIGPMPKLQAYPLELRQLFQNLITNAIKFSQPHSVPRIQVRAKEHHDHWEFSVQDNGIGIAPEYQERIFKIFQRLHSQADYEGSGIGLAYCQKIAELHMGKIWVRSVLGEGSTFFFTIAKP